MQQFTENSKNTSISAILKNKGKKRRSPRKPSPRKHSPRKIFLMPSLYPNQSTNTNNNNNTTPEITYNDPGKLEREYMVKN